MNFAPLIINIIILLENPFKQVSYINVNISEYRMNNFVQIYLIIYQSKHLITHISTPALFMIFDYAISTLLTSVFKIQKKQSKLYFLY